MTVEDILVSFGYKLDTASEKIVTDSMASIESLAFSISQTFSRSAADAQILSDGIVKVAESAKKLSETYSEIKGSLTSIAGLSNDAIKSIDGINDSATRLTKTIRNLRYTSDTTFKSLNNVMSQQGINPVNGIVLPNGTNVSFTQGNEVPEYPFAFPSASREDIRRTREYENLQAALQRMEYAANAENRRKEEFEQRQRIVSEKAKDDLLKSQNEDARQDFVTQSTQEREDRKQAAEEELKKEKLEIDKYIKTVALTFRNSLEKALSDAKIEAVEGLSKAKIDSENALRDQKLATEKQKTRIAKSDADIRVQENDLKKESIEDAKREKEAKENLRNAPPPYKDIYALRGRHGEMKVITPRRSERDPELFEDTLKTLREKYGDDNVKKIESVGELNDWTEQARDLRKYDLSAEDRKRFEEQLYPKKEKKSYYDSVTKFVSKYASRLKEGLGVSTDQSIIPSGVQSLLYRFIFPLKSILNPLTTLFSVHYIINTVEAYERVNNQLKNAVSNLREFQSAQERVLSVANETGTTYSSLANATTLMINSGNKSVGTVGMATEYSGILSKMFVSNGFSDTVAQSMLGSIATSYARRGRVSTEVSAAIADYMPDIVEMISESLGTSINYTKSILYSGYLTTGQLYSVLSNPENAAKIEKAYDSVMYTPSRAINEIKNDFNNLLYSTEKGVPLIEIIAYTLKGLWSSVKPVMEKITELYNKKKKSYEDEHPGETYEDHIVEVATKWGEFLSFVIKFFIGAKIFSIILNIIKGIETFFTTGFGYKAALGIINLIEIIKSKFGGGGSGSGGSGGGGSGGGSSGSGGSGVFADGGKEDDKKEEDKESEESTSKETDEGDGYVPETEITPDAVSVTSPYLTNELIEKAREAYRQKKEAEGADISIFQAEENAESVIEATGEGYRLNWDALQNFGAEQLDTILKGYAVIAAPFIIAGLGTAIVGVLSSLASIAGTAGIGAKIASVIGSLGSLGGIGVLGASAVSPEDAEGLSSLSNSITSKNLNPFYLANGKQTTINQKFEITNTVNAGDKDLQETVLDTIDKSGNEVVDKLAKYMGKSGS